jgi:hypothetical protein
MPGNGGRGDVGHGAIELDAMNRWPGRTRVAMEEYLRMWKRSCAEIGASQRLPIRVGKLVLG